MRKLLPALLGLLLLQQSTQAQTTIQRDSAIARMVQAVSADSLQSYISTLVTFGTRNTLSSTTDARKGIGAARNWVLGKFNQFAQTAGGRLTAVIDTTNLQPDGKRVDAVTNLGNVMATLKGTDPNDTRIFIISGHLDSRRTDVMDRTNDAPGANDDGSGCAAVLECARIMSRQQFPATIIFVTVSGEEQSLLGSTYLANKAKKLGWNVTAMLNNDIMGSNNSNETNIIENTRIRVFSEGLPAYELDKKAKFIRQMGLENDGPARQLARYVKETGERYVDNLEVVMVYRNDRFLRGGDHSPFVDNGFTAVRITEMNENFNHQHQDLRTEKGIEYGDLTRFMDFEYLRKNTALNLCNLANLASSAGAPDEVKMDVKNLTNSTFLYWKAPATGTPKGYYVLLRETTSAVWQKKFFTTATEMRLPYSKDNYFFAVQSVTAAGNESLPVVPGIGK
ncbi:M20/M25/M40 family metallo-hydrolase [Deminuibacter soli]|uniref:M20/M25/M40 family metallo-hydrolase n=1 Tax=Deminuibacter soli TaxID=2291815 RepID=A0A3E1ND90_9BACT|nr:M20/M25/M40 family metallo-hydrolase [Deminuibacter soli]RFM25965.1 M20/M25/M40 family metallo-hydrolase [Deminuibacter soli]